MPHIRKTSSGKYEILVSVGKDSNGGYKYKSKTFDTKDEARDWAADIRLQLKQGINFNSENATLKEYLLKWLKEYARPNVAPTTYDGYEMIVKKHIIPVLGDIKLKELKPIHIQSYQNNRLNKGKIKGKGGLSSTTVLQHHRVLSKALKQAVMWQLIPNNPCKSIQAPKKADIEIQVMTKKELKYIIDHADEKLKRVLIIAGYTGMRRSEILGLKWKYVDLINNSLAIKRALVRTNDGIKIKKPKTNSSQRSVAISTTLANLLKKIKKEQKEYKLYYGQDYKDNDLVFTHEDGECLKPDYISHGFKDLVRKLNMGQYKFHDLRHTHATLLLQSGEHPKKVQERLGHANISTTLDIYSHVTENMQKELADKFDQLME